MVRRFQDRWETNPQYRAMISAVVGLALIVTLCTCTGVMTLVANNALASLGLTNGSGSNNINSQTGTGNVKDGLKFPTATFGALTPVLTPVGSPIPSSQTPPPASTATPTATDNPTSTTGGGGPNTAQFVCTGTGNGITWTFSPCPLVHGQGGSLTISAPGHPNTGTNILVNFGNCTAGSNCTIDDPPSSTFQTNGSGTEVISFTVPADAQVGGPPMSGMIQLSSGQSVGINTVGSVT
jgi:hypothetical protein